MAGLSTLEHALTKHIRQKMDKYPSKTLKNFAFIISLSSCLCAGSVLLFPLFSPVLSHRLKLSQFQINIIGGFTSMGMYFPLPVLGYLADSHGPVILSVISMLFFSPSYLIAAYTVKNEWSFWILATTFAFIGCATSSLYFTCLLTCAKIFPESKGLTISAPVTAYGLSSLIGSQILKTKHLKDLDGELDLFKTFRLFSLLYIALGLFNWVSSTVVTIEKDLLLHKVLEQQNEETSLLNGSSNAYTVEDEIILEIDEVDHKKKYFKFLKDPSTYLLLFAILLTIGPSEMYITNMGSLIKEVSPVAEVSNQVSIHAIFSTLSRLTLGALSDLLLARFQISRVILLAIIFVLGAITQMFIATSFLVGNHYVLISALSGFIYGGLFTLFPTVVLSTWGSDIFGSTWGTFMIAPAIGSTEYGFLYAWIYDAKCVIEDASIKSNCVSHIFWITSGGFLISLVLLLSAWRFIWKLREQPEL